MTAASHADTPKRRRLAFLSQMVVLFVISAGVAFLIQHFGWHESSRNSLAFAVSIAMVIVAYEVGRYEGRHENDRPAGGSAPPKRRR